MCRFQGYLEHDRFGGAASHCIVLDSWSGADGDLGCQARTQLELRCVEILQIGAVDVKPLND